MSKVIDFTKPLSPYDVTYLQDRCRSIPADAELEDDDAEEYELLYEFRRKAELITECEDRGLDTDGTKAELVARLEASDKAE